MPRVTVTVDAVGGEGGRLVLLDEHVEGVHLEDEQSSVRFLERLAWAIEDGERLERFPSPTATATERSALTRRWRAQRGCLRTCAAPSGEAALPARPVSVGGKHRGERARADAAVIEPIGLLLRHRESDRGACGSVSDPQRRWLISGLQPPCCEPPRGSRGSHPRHQFPRSPRGAFSSARARRTWLARSRARMLLRTGRGCRRGRRCCRNVHAGVRPVAAVGSPQRRTALDFVDERWTRNGRVPETRRRDESRRSGTGPSLSRWPMPERRSSSFRIMQSARGSDVGDERRTRSARRPLRRSTTPAQRLVMKWTIDGSAAAQLG